MRRFLRDIQLRMMNFPDEHKQFQCLLSVTATQTGTLGEMLNEEQSETIVPLPPVKRIALNEDDHSKLTEMYKTLLPNCEVVILLKDFVTVFQEFKSVVQYTDVQGIMVF